MRRLVFLLSSIAYLATADRVVKTSNGLLEGVTVYSGEMDVEAYMGVPYAEPPVEQLRFGKPVPKRPWPGVYMASQQPPPCMQTVKHRYYEPNPENMTEDCLFLSLWVPYSKRTTELKPIILFTHGGGFILGSGNMPLYVGTNLAKFGDVIVANMNYRLGLWGFFLGYTEEAEGNMGIYDQILAMRWIKDNARSFGGDPDRIVLFGHSAGSMITGGHLISPLTRNLFQRVIMHSGAPTLPFILDDNKELYSNSERLAQLVGCADKKMTLKDNPSEVIKCLKRLPPQTLTEAEGLIQLTLPVPFYPRTGDAYLPKPVIHLLREGRFKDTEMLIGYAEYEGTFFLTEGVPDYFGTFGKGRANNFSKRLTYLLVRAVFGVLDKAHKNEIAAYYINPIENGTADTYVLALARAMGDYIINCDTYFNAEYHSLRNPVYYFIFMHRPSTTLNAEWMKATHVDDLQYVFGNSMIGNFTPEEIEFSERMMARWVTFAKTGKPNVPGLLEWPKFSHDNPVYMDINLEESIRLRPDNYRCEFWRDKFQADFGSDIIKRIKRSSNGSFYISVNVLLIILCVSLSLFCTTIRSP